MKLKELESGDRVLNYEDVYLVPNIGVVTSRDQVDVDLKWGKFKFSVPVCPSNMLSVIDEKIAEFCSINQVPYFYHRFGQISRFVYDANKQNWAFIGISVGVKQEDKDLLQGLKDSGLRVDAVLVDVAHGAMDSVSDMIIYSRALGFYTGAGNIWGDRQSVEFLQDAGAEFIKQGLSCGKNCSTYSTTSFGSPMFSAAIEMGKWATVPVIIDGGTRNNGDIVKAIRGFLEYGKTVPLVMLGNLFAACIDAPGDNIYNPEYYKAEQIIREYNMSETYNGPLGEQQQKRREGYCKFILESLPIKKRHWGSASKHTKEQTGQPIRHIEGFEVELTCNGMTFEDKIEEIRQSLQSAVSYAGGTELSAIGNAKWVTVK